MCKQAANLTLEKDLGPKRYTDNVCQNMPIRKSISKMNQKARKVLKNRFTTAHYLAKKQKAVCRLSRVRRPARIEWSRG